MNVTIDNLGANFSALSDITIGGIISMIIQLILGISGIIAFIFLLWGGLQWILSGGDKEGTEKARKRITAALIGLAIVFSAYALIIIIEQVFGVELRTFTLPTISG